MLSVGHPDLRSNTPRAQYRRLGAGLLVCSGSDQLAAGSFTAMTQSVAVAV